MMDRAKYVFLIYEYLLYMPFPFHSQLTQLTSLTHIDLKQIQTNQFEEFCLFGNFFIKKIETTFCCATSLDKFCINYTFEDNTKFSFRI